MPISLEEVPSSERSVLDEPRADAMATGRGRLDAALATARPRQWLKNALIIAAAGAAGALGRDDVPGRVCLAFAGFCMLAAGVYAINDARDAVEDRLHPRKRFRPVAAGETSPRSAVICGCGSIVAGLLLCTAVRPLLGLVAAAYVGLTVTYTLVWRHIVVLDLVAIAGGFVLRAVAGGVAAPVSLSRWFILVVTFASILVAAGKRRAELLRTDRISTTGRRVLRLYSDRTLRAILVVAATGVIVAYCLWAFELSPVGGVPWRVLTIAPFAATLLRYGLLLRRGDGETPEDLIIGDRWLAFTSAVWLLLFALSVNAAD